MGGNSEKSENKEQTNKKHYIECVNGIGGVVVAMSQAQQTTSSSLNSPSANNNSAGGAITTTPTSPSQTTTAPNLSCSFGALNSGTIKKRKAKFTVQLNIQELLSVPYLNGVLFCKIRLCEGGNHVSYSSK